MNSSKEISDLCFLKRLSKIFELRDGILWRLSRARGRSGWKKAPSTPNCRNGYVQIGVDGKTHYAHRIIFALHTGRWPKLDIDHIDCNKGNNSVDNLREATRSQNMRNIIKPRNGKKSNAPRGVCWDKKAEKWLSQCTINGKSKFVGLFNSKEEARLAVVAYEMENLLPCDLAFSPVLPLPSRILLASQLGLGY